MSQLLEEIKGKLDEMIKELKRLRTQIIAEKKLKDAAAYKELGGDVHDVGGLIEEEIKEKEAKAAV